MSTYENPTNQPHEVESATIQMDLSNDNNNNTEPETDSHVKDKASNVQSDVQTNEEQKETVKIKKGETAKQLKKITDIWIKSCIRSNSLSTMLEIFEPIVPDMVDEIKECHSQGEEYMAAEFKRLVKSLFEERHLVEKQNKLDRLVKEAQGRERVETHLLPTPSQVTAAVLYNEKKQELYRLQNELENITRDNYELMNKVQFEQLEMEKKQAKLNSMVEDLNKNLEVGNAMSQKHLIEVMEDYDYNTTRNTDTKFLHVNKRQ